jgi:hypothetical protein
MKPPESQHRYLHDDYRHHVQKLAEASIQTTTRSSGMASTGRGYSLKRNTMQRMTMTDYDCSRSTFSRSHESEEDAMLPHLVPLMLARLGIDYSSSTRMRHGGLAVSKKALLHPQLNHHRLNLWLTTLNVVQNLPDRIRVGQNLCGGVDTSLPCHPLQACR